MDMTFRVTSLNNLISTNAPTRTKTIFGTLSRKNLSVSWLQSRRSTRRLFASGIIAVSNITLTAQLSVGVTSPIFHGRGEVQSGCAILAHFAREGDSQSCSTFRLKNKTPQTLSSH